MLTQFANLGSCVIVQLACAMVQLTMCYVLCVGRNHLSMFFQRQAIDFLFEHTLLCKFQNVFKEQIGLKFEIFTKIRSAGPVSVIKPVIHNFSVPQIKRDLQKRGSVRVQFGNP